MSDIVIKAENLGKKYIIGHQAQRGGYTALRDVLMQNARTLWNKTKDLATGKAIIQGDTMEEVWALKDVSFEIHRGEAVGIIGRNGAGKSTLLKVLSRITEPTTGRVTIKGRVASLLEVGTGFHPELTGRENIYLNGTILGMTRAEVKRKFDEIVAFAEVEKYLDTPVKRYSSGMYVRLAFAVAAHLEPEILVVDEVLAVGDAAFQKKCLGKMSDVAHAGRTVLFVSHNMGAVGNLCSKGILLGGGEIASCGLIKDVIGKYLSVHAGSGDVDLNVIKERTGSGRARFIRAVTKNDAGDICDTFTIGDDLIFDISILSPENIRSGRMSLSIVSSNGIRVYQLVAVDAGFELTNIQGEATIRIALMSQKIYPGEYNVDLWLADTAYEAFDRILNALKFYVVEGGSMITRKLDHSAAVVHEIPEWSRIK
jgi:lipopolysaccharide transport system ATP-binding protein